MKISFRWIENPGMLKRMWTIFVTTMVFLVAVDFFVARDHTYLVFETIPGFSAVYGFVACVALVLVAKILRTVCKRDLDYYD